MLPVPFPLGQTTCLISAPCLKTTSHIWFAIALTYVYRFWFFVSSRNVTDKVSNQNMLYYATSNNLCFCTTWQSGETWKLRCSLKCCISAPVAAWFLQFFWVTTHTLLYDSINLVINAFSSGLLGAWFRRKEVESAAAVGLCCRHNVPVHCILSFLFRKVMLKRWVGEVGKQSIVWFLTFL